VDRDAQVGIAEAVLKTFRTKEFRLTYGTPYHTGEAEDWEKVLADRLGAKIETEIHADVNGLICCIKHHISNSSSPVSAATALKGAQLRQMLWSAHEQQPLANLIIRSHIHRCVAVLDPALNFQCWTTPALQGLGGRFGTRQCDGLPVHFGFLEIDVSNQHDWCVTPHILPGRFQAAAVSKI
jgi:hypothetical protein